MPTSTPTPAPTPLTAEQIARRVGLSNATVSRVLNNSQHVSPAAREAVMAVVRETGHMPRLLGRRTVRRASAKAPGTQAGLVEVLMVMRFPVTPIAPDAADVSRPAVRGGEDHRLPVSDFFAPDARLSTSFPRHIIDGIIDEVRRFEQRAIVHVVENLRSRQLLAEVNRRENRGLFLIGAYDPDIHPFLEGCRCPVVTFTTWDHNGWPDYVGIDNHRGIRLGFEHLRKLGHARIGYVAGEMRYSAVFRERLAIFKTLLADAGLPYRPDWIIEGSCELDPIQRSAEAILRKSDERPTAMLCSFDGAAVGIKRAADRLGLHIPADLSVVGFDDADLSQLFTPPLTTVRVPTHLMGQHAVQLMMMRQQRPIRPGEAVSLRVTPTLIERQSTAPPRA